MAPKNFDAQRIVVADENRQFQISGQLFTIKRRVRPEVLGILSHLGDDETDISAKIELIDSGILQILVTDDQPRWTQLRASEDDDLLDFVDLRNVLNWAIEVLTSRPLESVASSGNGSAPPETPSPDVSSLPVAFPSTG